MDTLKDVMYRAAWEAGMFIAEAWRTGRSAYVEEKAPHDYVTDVDREAERRIITVLRGAFPDDTIIAEESFTGDYDERRPAWIVDPLDGTTNFIHHFPMISVSIARYEHGSVVAGCVLDPLREECFYAARGEGVFRNGQRLPPPSATVTPLAKSLIATGFPFRRKAFLSSYLRSFGAVFHGVGDIRRAGSAALDLTYVACGRLDGFWETGLKPWDIAAGALFITERGGIVTDFQGGGMQDAIWSGNVVAASSESLHAFLLQKARLSMP